MAGTNIYGELIRAQLQNSAADLTPTATGLFYFNTTTGLKWYNGSAWKIGADLDSTQTFTGKTISGASNTITSISLTTAVTGILPTANGGTGQNSTAVFPASGTVATTSNNLGAFAATTSAQLAGVLSDETGTGVAVFGTSPVISTPDIDGGTASNTSRITLPKASTATLSGLTRKAGTVVYDTTLTKPFYDDGANLIDFAGAAGLDRPTETINYSIACSVAANALTIYLKDKAGSDPTAGSPVKVSFRNATGATGDYSQVSATAATSLVVSSGSTLGHTSATSTTMYLYALNNAGTLELAVSTSLFDCLTTQTTVAEGGAGAADSATDIYSTTARTSKAIRLLARLVSSQTTAGTWTAVPTQISLTNTQVTPSAFTVVDSAAEYSANTKLGLMPYFHGGSYLAADAPTVGNYTSSGNGGTLANIRSVFIPYQMQDGTWRMKFLINFSVSGQTSGTNNFSFTISGITTKNTGSFNQQVSCSPIGNATSYSSYMAPNSNVVTLLSTANLNNASVTAQGDIELNAKPNWAY